MTNQNHRLVEMAIGRERERSKTHHIEQSCVVTRTWRVSAEFSCTSSWKKHAQGASGWFHIFLKTSICGHKDATTLAASLGDGVFEPPEHLHLCGCLHGQCPADSKLYHFDPFYIAQIQMIQSKRAEANNRVPLRPFPVLHIFSPLPQEILHNLRANGLHPGSNAMKRSLMKLV